MQVKVLLLDPLSFIIRVRGFQTYDKKHFYYYLSRSKSPVFPFTRGGLMLQQFLI